MKKKLIYIAVICIIFSLTLFYYNNVKIPKIENAVENELRGKLDLERIEKRKVAVAKEEIKKYTVLNHDVIDSAIEIKEIPIMFTSKNTINNIDDLLNKVTQENFEVGEQITANSLSNTKDWFEPLDRYKEYEFSATVAGELKEGNIIDVIVNYGNGDYDIVIPKIKVQQIKEYEEFKDKERPEDEDIDESRDDEEPKLTDSKVIILSTTNIEHRNMNLAEQLGKFEARIYIDELQAPSEKTFDYEKALKQLEELEKLKIENVNSKQEEDSKEDPEIEAN